MSADRTYPADEVDKHVEDLAKGAQEVLREKKAADARIQELEAENAEQREKLAQADKVELEKVATAPFSFEKAAMDKTLDKLIEKNIIVPEAREDTMQKLASDPAYALDMMQHFANFNVEPLAKPRGGGIDPAPETVKAASAADDSDWFEQPADEA